MPAAVEVLLFDLGGVLVEFSGVRDLARLLGDAPSDEDVLARWASCPHSLAFGNGDLDAPQFAERFVREWGVTVAPDAFLVEWRSWARGLLPGAADLLTTLRSRYRLAALSNCNALHWDRLATDLGVLDFFDDAMSSHQLRCRKPSPAIFEAALAQLEVSPRQVVFFDDSRGNVEAARALGMRARLVDGPDAVRRCLVDDGLL